MNRSTIQSRILAGTAGVAWAAALADATPWVDMGTASGFALVVAGVTTLTLTFRSRTRPIAEVYQCGYDAGRRDAEIDAASRSVIPFRRRAAGERSQQIG